MSLRTERILLDWTGRKGCNLITLRSLEINRRETPTFDLGMVGSEAAPLRIRLIEPGDFFATRKLIQSAAPEREECAQAWAEGPGVQEGSSRLRSDFVAVVEGETDSVVGYASIWPQGSGRFRMDLIVGQAWRCKGLGSALMDHLIAELSKQRATIVQARTLGNRPEALSFLHRLGFSETNRMIRLKLNVAEALGESLEQATQRMAAKGISVVALAQAKAQDRDWHARVQELVQVTNPGRVSNPYRLGEGRGFESRPEYHAFKLESGV
jgi:GNAT superfamily N-acetyltransferase